jgi:tetratricopeptide (TPR) repeat protein
MTFTSSCPRCQSQISEERARSIPAICDHCGYVLSSNEHAATENFQKSYKIHMVVFSALVVLGYLSFATWGGYTLEMRWLQLGEFLGSNSQASKERIATICVETGRYECAEEAFLSMARSDVKQLVRLGKFQMSQTKYTQAAETFGHYLAKNEDSNFDVSYLYARSLGESGRIDEASEIYEKIIRAKTDVLQVTVIQKYVDMLKRSQRWSQAKNILDEIRKRDESVADFMQRDYTEISEHLGKEA